MNSISKKLKGFLPSIKNLNPMKRTAKSAISPKNFYGRPITLNEALKVTDELVDYYTAIKYNRSRIPKKPHAALGYLLRCNSIAQLHHIQVNLNLKMALKRNYLEQEEVVWAWLVAHRYRTDRPLVTLGNLQIRLEDKSMSV